MMNDEYQIWCKHILVIRQAVAFAPSKINIKHTCCRVLSQEYYIQSTKITI